LLGALRDLSNQRAWEAFSDRYRPILVDFGNRLNLCDHDAQDAAQETLLAFIEAYRAGKYDRDKGRLGKWLLGIARNKILHLQRSRRRAIQVADNSGQTGFFEKVPDDNSVSELWEEQWRQAMIDACLAEVRKQVEPSTVRAFTLLTLKGRTPEQTAAELGMSVNAVMKANRRVLSRMREMHACLEGGA
jgi:RNA polymerase sigma factor (sigma-70 family)